VVNLSLGRGVFESYTLDPLDQAVEQVWNAGIVVVVAAGNYGRDNSNNNNGYGTITAPGNDPYVITVGAMKTMGTATRADDLIATYSSKGPTMLDHHVGPRG
jgi:serine protease AprX